ncbi:MAG: IS91 family transposase [Lachnospiraceae bacterium]|nr:IS91 family transposase [Lachnospiraceae bacterium]
MERAKIQQVFDNSWKLFSSCHSVPLDHLKAARSIMSCKTEDMGYNISTCEECGYSETHYNSCRNRNCPNCQAILKEIWIDKRKAEVIDSRYYHVVFTVPEELNALIYANQKVLYSLMHKASSETLLELARDRKYLGATPGIIQVLHTWGQELNYHPHIHCIVSAGGLTPDHRLRTSSDKFFIPVRFMRNVFKGKFLFYLKKLYDSDELIFPGAIGYLSNPGDWHYLLDLLYSIDWCPYIKETFNGFGNAIEYLGRYTHRIAITNTRVQSVTADKVSFLARDYKTGTSHVTTIDNTEFIRRLLMHVLPRGFQKIRYYGFLNNRFRYRNLELIFKLQGFQRFRSMYTGMSAEEILLAAWGFKTNVCRNCGCTDCMRITSRKYPRRC